VDLLENRAGRELFGLQLAARLHQPRPHLQEELGKAQVL
jgi:hypothetical protein